MREGEWTRERRKERERERLQDTAIPQTVCGAQQQELRQGAKGGKRNCTTDEGNWELEVGLRLGLGLWQCSCSSCTTRRSDVVAICELLRSIGSATAFAIYAFVVVAHFSSPPFPHPLLLHLLALLVVLSTLYVYRHTRPACTVCKCNEQFILSLFLNACGHFEWVLADADDIYAL